MACVNGLKLSDRARREALGAFGYRWTRENEKRARAWYAVGKVEPPTMALISDSDWLAQHAFHVKKDGTLNARRRFAESACCADGWAPSG